MSTLLLLWTLRVLGAVGFGAVGWWLCLSIGLSTTSEFVPWGPVFAGSGVIIGGVLLPYLITGPVRGAAKHVSEMPGATLVASLLGLVVGLIVASLISIPFYALSGMLGLAVPVAISLACGWAGLWVGIQRERDIRAIMPGLDVGERSNSALPTLTSPYLDWTQYPRLGFRRNSVRTPYWWTRRPSSTAG